MDTWKQSKVGMHGRALDTDFMEFFSIDLEELFSLVFLCTPTWLCHMAKQSITSAIVHGAATASDESYHVPLRRYM